MVAPLCMIFGCDMLMWQKAGSKYTNSDKRDYFPEPCSRCFKLNWLRILVQLLFI